MLDIALILMFSVYASIFATVIPRRTPVKLPGPSITIISFNSLVVILLSFRISSINGTV